MFMGQMVFKVDMQPLQAPKQLVFFPRNETKSCFHGEYIWWTDAPVKLLSTIVIIIINIGTVEKMTQQFKNLFPVIPFPAFLRKKSWFSE